MNQDLTQDLAAQVMAAQAEGRPLRIQGGGTKTWLGRRVAGEPLAVGGHRGILSYEPTELVITARAGTPLAEIQAALAERGQWLAFEPPHFSPADGLGDDPLDAGANISAGVDPGGRPNQATLGGTIACGLAGPARPYTGAARDFVLGVRLINGKGEVLRFGGEVMKNVAGYDLSRLMAGAQGTLGVLLDISLKVLPRPAEELTLVFEMSPVEALQSFNAWAGKPLPLSAACHDGERTYVRLAGNGAAVRSARTRLGGEVLDDRMLADRGLVARDLDREPLESQDDKKVAAWLAGSGFWRGVRELRHPFFQAASVPLWRISLPPTAPLDPRLGRQFIDWGGAQRWVHSEDPLWPVAQAVGGHASYYGRRFSRSVGAAGAAGAAIAAIGVSGASAASAAASAVSTAQALSSASAVSASFAASGATPVTEVFQPLPPALLVLHQRLKAALDPRGILNPGRIYPEL